MGPTEGKCTVARSFIILVLAACSICNYASAQTYKFSVDPAVRSGRPRINVTTDADNGVLTATVVALDKAATSVLAHFPILKIRKAARVELPAVQRDTFVEVQITTETETSATAFAWRTMLRPNDTPLMDYQGQQEMLPPHDFDAYWARAKRELAAVKMRPVVTRVPDKDTSTGLLHRVELPSVEETTIVCWYYVPRNALDDKGRAKKKCPAVLIAPGYGAEEPPIDRTTSGIITMSINPRNHGPSKSYWKAPVEHSLYNIDEPEHYYYKLAYLDCLRAAQFVFSRPEVDSKRVATEGGSQGGLFAIATAALEPRIACVASNVTAFSDYPDGFILARRGHHSHLGRILADETTASKKRASLAYTDGANMATRVKCPVQINMGGQDPVCHYICGIVVHNRLRRGVEREYNIVPDAKHQVHPEMRKHNARWLQKWLKLR